LPVKTKFMKNNVFILFAICLISQACKDSGIDDIKLSTALNTKTNAAQSGTWTRLADYPGRPRASSGIQFSIGNKVYMGSGADGLVMEDYSFWEYDTDTGIWSEKKYGGSASSEMASFSIGNKGYSVAGGRGELEYIYSTAISEYDPSTDTWALKGFMPADGRRAPAGFSIGNKGYVGLGQGLDREVVGDLYFRDFWEYSPTSNCWTRKRDFPGRAGKPATSFSLGKFGYILTQDSSSNFWRYEPKSDTWAKMADFPGVPRTDGALGFGLLGKGYVGTGHNHRIFLNDFWQYDPATDNWLQLGDFQGRATNQAFGVSTGTKGYIKTGDTQTYFDHSDFWEFDPSK
ncbi:MAG: type sorting protein, partial [Daejeonella sp.]|nr:type sorting protein [Daejeonella sp.]